MTKRDRRARGTTLIELIVTIAVLAVMSVGLLSFLQYSVTAKDRTKALGDAADSVRLATLYTDMCVRTMPEGAELQLSLPADPLRWVIRISLPGGEYRFLYFDEDTGALCEEYGTSAQPAYGARSLPVADGFGAVTISGVRRAEDGRVRGFCMDYQFTVNGRGVTLSKVVALRAG